MNKNIESAMGNIDSKIDRTHEAVDAMAARAEQGVVKAANGVAQEAHNAGTWLLDTAQSATSGAHQRLNDSAKAIDRGYDRARAGVSRATATATGFVSANPGTALMAVASAGFVLGILAHRRLSAA